MTFVSASAAEVDYGDCRGCGRPLTHARQTYPGWHDACAARSGLTQPLTARGEVPAALYAPPSRVKQRISRNLTANERKDNLIQTLGSTCYFCGCGLSRRNATREHLTPTSRGGSNTAGNVVAACIRCNGAKGNMTEDEFRGWLKRVATYYLGYGS